MMIENEIPDKGSIMKVVNFSWSSFHKKFDWNFAFGTIGPYSSILEWSLAIQIHLWTIVNQKYWDTK